MDHIETAIAAFQNGFPTEAAKIRAIEELNEGFGEVRNRLQESLVAKAKVTGKTNMDKTNFFHLNSIPEKLKKVKDGHINLIESYLGEGNTVRKMQMLTELINMAPVDRSLINPFAERHEEVRKALAVHAKKVKKDNIEGIELPEIFGDLALEHFNVTVNLHKSSRNGKEYVRSFFYLNGELRPLYLIFALQDAIKAVPH